MLFVFEKEWCKLKTFQKNLKKDFAYQLGVIKTIIEVENKLDYTDDNKDAEMFFSGLFNLMYGYKLKNLNDQIQNTPGIDLGDEKAKVCYQITSRNDREKIKESLHKFKKFKWDKVYDNLYIFIIGTKKKYKDFPEYDFDLDNIIDIPKIIKEICNLPYPEQEKILKYLISEGPLLKNNDEYIDVQLKKGTYSKFLKKYFISEYRKTGKKIINQFSEELSDLDRTTRVLIYAIMMKSVDVDDGGISFDSYDILKRLKWSEDIFIKELNILRRKGWVDVKNEMDIIDVIREIDDWECYNKYLLCLSYSKDGNEWFNMLYDFLKTKSKNKKQLDEYFEKLILNLNFTVLN